MTGARLSSETGPWPMGLPRLFAQVTSKCSYCGHVFAGRVLLVSHWMDRAGGAAQISASDGLACPACDEVNPSSIPLLQRRFGDAVDLLVALPEHTDMGDDDRWLASAREGAGALLSGTQSVVAIRPIWWPFLAEIPLGPVLAGLKGVPVPDSIASEEECRVLRNIPAERTSAGLEAVEYELTFARRDELEREPIAGPFDFGRLKETHRRNWYGTALLSAASDRQFRTHERGRAPARSLKRVLARGFVGVVGVS